jgi:hypothetical protein
VLTSSAAQLLGLQEVADASCLVIAGELVWLLIPVIFAAQWIAPR